jgi:hypothetical protein
MRCARITDTIIITPATMPGSHVIYRVDRQFRMAVITGRR